MNKKDKSFCLSINVLTFLFIILYGLFCTGCAEKSSLGTLSPIIIVSDSIEELFKNSLIIDGNLNYTVKQDSECRKDCDLKRIDLGLIKGLTGVNIGSINVSSDFGKLVNELNYVNQNEGALVIKTFNDLEKAREEKKYGVLFYSQKHFRLNGTVDPISEWFANGLRIVQLAYSSQDTPNQSPQEKLGGGSDEPDQGLTELGRSSVRELNRLHMIIDVSHCSEKTTMELIQMSNVPILANHANAKFLTDVARNKTNRELLAIAETGGVIGITPIAWMIDRDGDGKGNIDDFIAHIDYMVNLVGIDHVGVASDSVLDGWGSEERHYSDAILNSYERWKIVATRLQEDLGYTDLQLEKIFGLNYKRVYEEVLPGLVKKKEIL